VYLINGESDGTHTLPTNSIVMMPFGIRTS